MPDQTQQPSSQLPPTIDFVLPPEPPAEVVNEHVDSRAVDEDELARQELARINPSKEKLRALAAKNPPLPKWFDEEEPPPF